MVRVCSVLRKVIYDKVENFIVTDLPEVGSVRLTVCQRLSIPG